MLLRLLGDFRRAMDLSLVLDAEQIEHELRSLEEERWGLFVADGDAARAEGALAAFERENPIGASNDEPEAGGVGPALVYGLGLLALHAWTGPEGPWFEHGSAAAERIVHGEWFRVLTALTLHADAAHAVGNAVLGGFALAMLTRRLGAAAASWLMLAAGAAGTALTALILRAHFSSVGASTAVFGAIGALAALRARDPRRRRQAWVYLGAGLALLGFLGSGKRADLAGHALGFLCGVVLGAAAARLRPPARKMLDGAVASLALLPLALAWVRAFR